MYLTDLKIIDELLCDLKENTGLSWRDIENFSNLTSYAMKRLEEAWNKGEMDTITLGLSEYFNSKKQ